MVFEITDKELHAISGDIIVTFAFEGKGEFLPTNSFSSLDKHLEGALAKAAVLEKFTGKEGQTISIYTFGKIPAPKIVVLGLGKKDEFDSRILRRSLAKLAKAYRKKINSLVLSPLSGVDASISTSEQAQIITEGLFLGGYEFGKYKKKEKGERELALAIISADTKQHTEIKKGVDLGELYSQATRLARDLVNEQASIATPSFLAQVAQDIAKKDKHIKVKIFDRAECEKMGMEAFLGVARAADTPPKFIVLEYLPAGRQGKVSGSKSTIGLVGKGITFDSGGINVKPGDHMQTMKMDMSGAAAVLGVFSVISALKPTVSVLGVIAATPNLISGKALVPGDVLRALNGKTIEVLNTDAEGRVTMADSLSYAVKAGATHIIDLATLTGACMVALGTEIAGLMSNNQEFAAKVKSAAYDAGEEVWELPLTREYKELNKSEVADIANIPNTRYGGTITAGLFLQEFVDNKPWVHLDIAGPAFAEREAPLSPKGGTGFGVRTLLNLLRS